MMGDGDACVALTACVALIQKFETVEQEAMSRSMAVQKANRSENDSNASHKMTFTLPGVLLGAKRTIPLAISVFAIGFVFGVLARQAKLNVIDALLMSGLVYAGASQFVA